MANEHNGFRGRLRGFIEEHPDGWNHHEWLALLAELADTGLNTSDPDGIGAALEHERLLVVLERVTVKGLGPKRREVLAARFGGLWHLKHASVDEIAAIPTFTRTLAQALHEALNG